MAATAAELCKTVQLRNPREHSQSIPLLSLAGSAMLLMAANSKSKTAGAAESPRSSGMTIRPKRSASVACG